MAHGAPAGYDEGQILSCAHEILKSFVCDCCRDTEDGQFHYKGAREHFAYCSKSCLCCVLEWHGLCRKCGMHLPSRVSKCCRARIQKRIDKNDIHSIKSCFYEISCSTQRMQCHQIFSRLEQISRCRAHVTKNVFQRAFFQWLCLMIAEFARESIAKFCKSNSGSHDH